MDPVLRVALCFGLFAATHLGLGSPRVRIFLIARLGRWGFTALFTLVAWLTFGFAISSYAAHAGEGPAGLALGASAGARIALIAAITLGVMLMTGAFATYSQSPFALAGQRVREPRGLERVTRHPFFVGLSLLGAAHALLAPRLVGAVAMGSLALVAGVGAWFQDRKLLALRGQGYRDYLAVTSAIPFAAILAGRQQLVWAELPYRHAAARARAHRAAAGSPRAPLRSRRRVRDRRHGPGTDPDPPLRAAGEPAGGAPLGGGQLDELRSPPARCASADSRVGLLAVDRVTGTLVDGLGAAAATSGILTQQQARIFGLLYLAAQPLSLDEIAEELSQSKSNVSLNMRVLVEWHLVRRRPVPGSRKDHYEAATDFFRAMQEIFERRFRWTVRQVLSAAADARAAAAAGPRPARGEAARAADWEHRLAGLEAFFGLIDNGIGAFVSGAPFPAEKLRNLIPLPAGRARLR